MTFIPISFESAVFLLGFDVLCTKTDFPYPEPSDL